MPAAVSLLSLLLAGSLLAAQPAGRKKAPRAYDPATEVTQTGTVEAVDDGARGGTHVTLKTSSAACDVHLGPTAYLRKIGLSVAKGDTLEVTGSKITDRGADAVLARTVKKGGAVYELRNKEGIPHWSRGRRAN